MDGDTVIIGIGDERRRDDGVGLAIARQLAGSELPPGVRVEEAGHQGFDLPAALQEAARAVVLAAAKLGAPPGTVHVLSPTDAEARADYLSSAGAMALIDALELATMLGATPEVLIVGVEPAEIVPGRTLSRPVADAVARAAEMALMVALREP